MIFMTNIVETFLGSILDSLGTSSEVVKSNGNITVYNIIDNESGKTIGQNVMMVRDGMYVSTRMDEPSTLRQQVMEKLGLKGGENI